MDPVQSKTWPDEDRLGQLAAHFRRIRDEATRRAIAEEYSDTVSRLIESGSWEYSPSLEDQLPRAWMPKAFFEYWMGSQDVA